MPPRPPDSSSAVTVGDTLTGGVWKQRDAASRVRSCQTVWKEPGWEVPAVAAQLRASLLNGACATHKSAACLAGCRSLCVGCERKDMC